MARRTIRGGVAFAISCVATTSCTALLGNDFEIDDAIGVSGFGGTAGLTGGGAAGSPAAGNANVGGAGAGGVQGDGGGGTGGGGAFSIKQIVAGARATCALLATGRLRCWGEGPELGYGKAIAVGDDEPPSKAGDVPAGGQIAYVSTGGPTCAVFAAGTVRCWGQNAFGELGYGNTTPIGGDVTPSLWNTLSLSGKAMQVASGTAHACALLESGQVQCWGLGLNGRLGYGKSDPPASPPNVGDDEVPANVGVINLGSKATRVELGEAHGCALLENRKVRCWGKNDFGQLGYGNKVTIGDDEAPKSAIEVELFDVKQISVGGNHTCAVLADGTLRCWGLNDAGQLGYGTKLNFGDDLNETLDAGKAVDFGAQTLKVAEVAAGGRHTCARLVDGSVRCWGKNDVGQLGYGNSDTVGFLTAPGGPLNFGNVKAVQLAAGSTHACAVFDDGGVRCWGQGSGGRLGYGNTDNVGDTQTVGVVGRVEVF